MPSLRRAVMFLVFVLLAANAWAQSVGRVQFVSGLAEVERGAQRLRLQPASEVQQGDLLLTGADGHLQLVMIDAAHVSLRPNSRMRIDRYEFDVAKPGVGQALLSLVTGAMHAFTGEIVNRDRDKFKMRTPLASIGIRGSGNILAHLEETGTINHTLTGAHSVTSFDELGIERTLISFPGQTIQVRPGQPPRFIPTPAFIMASASQPTKAESAAQKTSQAAQASASGTATSATAASASTSASSSTGSASSSTSSSATTSATSESAPATTSSGGTTTTASTSTSSGGTTPAAASESAPPSATAPTTTTASTISSSSATVATSQATTATVGSSIVTAQPTANSGYETQLRFFNPLPGGGFEGVLVQSSFDGSGGAVLDAAGRLVQVSRAVVGTFLAGPGAPPPGYNGATYTGSVSFDGGEHHDGFRSTDSSVILGRWTGGTVSVTDDSGGRTVFDLGARSVSYDVTTPTVAGVIASFTGTATYNLAAATAPTDASGNAGSVTTASVLANFSARTVSGNFGLAISGRTFTLSGTSDLAPGSPRFTFASSLQNLSIGCSGNCSALGYLGTLNGLFAGPTGQWMSVSYRINPDRVPGNGFSDFVVGSIALNSETAPTIGIVLPQSGIANLAFTAVDPSRSFINYPNAVGAPSISGTLQANFTNHTASFSATVAGGCNCSLPTFTASASDVPIVGAGFSATTDAQRSAGVGSMTVACSGNGCGSSGSATGRFDGLFRSSSGTNGTATRVVGDSAGNYDVTASFGPAPSARANVVAADASSAIGRLANPHPVSFTGTYGIAGSRMGASRIP